MHRQGSQIGVIAMYEKTYEDMIVEELNAIFVPNTENIPVHDSAGACWHNKMVGCTNRSNCGKCGWNPAVAELRSQDIRRRLGLVKDKD